MLDPLFSGTPISKAIDERRRQALASVAVLPRTELLESGLDELVAERVKLYRFNTLVLNWKGKKLAPSEVDLTISRLQPGNVAGMAITLLVPFSGMSGLLYMRPSTHIERPPRGFVWGQKLLLSYFRIRPDPTTAQRYLVWQEAAVKEHVSSINNDVGTFNAELPELLRSAVQARLDKQWLRVLADTWVKADIPEAKADLLHAIYERIVVVGRSIVSARLTPAAYSNGLALALPQVVMARPEGFEPPTI